MMNLGRKAKMKIAFIDIQNFRKLKQCRINLSGTTTLFVGANNSGKTSAMDALAKFLAKRNFVFNDITLSNKSIIVAIGQEWEKEEYVIPDSLENWECIFPSLDVWLDVTDNEIQYVAHIIPTLDWKGGILGVRFIYQPKDISKMYAEYRESYIAARKTESSNPSNTLALWPKNLCDFLEKRLSTLCTLKAYILDPEKANNEQPQKTAYDMECFEQNPLEGLIHIDIISAQRGFYDPESRENNNDNTSSGNLSSQLRSYYDKHLDPEKSPTPEDISTLQALETAKIAFNQNLGVKFKEAIEELEKLGYPGINDPQITIATKVNATETLKHESAVQYSLIKNAGDDYKLPEKYNGLGYQNLVSMVFLLMRFRDDWMQVGKAKQEKELAGQKIAPLHLVLLEEPEAHLHMQVQQVFINKAYSVLRKHKFLSEHPNFCTQLVVSSHSSHIAREVSFANLRYFKRLCATTDCNIPTTKVINLSDVFGKEDETDKFVTRYLQTTHCDLFFADAVIMVEGSAEKMLIPHFIRNKYPELNQRYITMLEINGSHAHRLKPLIDKLCLTTLIITDLDPVSHEGHHPSVYPQRNKQIITGNDTLKSWIPKKTSFDELLDLSYEEKSVSCNIPYCYSVRVAYQTPLTIDYKADKAIEALSSTLEDAIVYSNIDLLGNLTGTGLINTFNNLIENKNNFAELHADVYAELHKKNVKKAEFALDLIYSVDPEKIAVPLYISQGLNWLQEQLRSHE
jgi:predicted ATP-dependent endonuclease of OLD family